jgi:hypothetical protein
VKEDFCIIDCTLQEDCWKYSKKTDLNTLFAMALTMLLLGCAAPTEKVIHVNADASTEGDGKSWGMAYKYLQNAIDDAGKGDEIWVATGTYKPTVGIGGSGDRNKSFQLKKGVALYGGFAGTETSRKQRNWQTNETILSGDLKGDDVGFTNNGENSYHVVIGDKTDATAVLDGFIITGGNADADVWPNDGGGGMSTYQGSPTVKNCLFSENAAFADGGGMRNWGDSKPLITNCTFLDNKVAQEGGGMMNGPGSRPDVTNCIFTGNSAGEDGGGMYNNETSGSLIMNCLFRENSAELTGGGMYNVNGSDPRVINCSFSGNQAGEAGGAVCNTRSNPSLTNCILWGNSAATDPEIHNVGSAPIITFCNIAGGYDGEGNIDANPIFAETDLRLSAGSPCIDAGSTAALPAEVETDLDANTRIFNHVVDMGAYEFARQYPD